MDTQVLNEWVDSICTNQKELAGLLAMWDARRVLAQSCVQFNYAARQLELDAAAFHEPVQACDAWQVTLMRSRRLGTDREARACAELIVAPTPEGMVCAAEWLQAHLLDMLTP